MLNGHMCYRKCCTVWHYCWMLWIILYVNCYFNNTVFRSYEYNTKLLRAKTVKNAVIINHALGFFWTIEQRAFLWSSVIKSPHIASVYNAITNAPSPSASTSLIMSCSSASVGFWPSDLITVPSSFVVMVPSPSLSNSRNASLNSEKNYHLEYIIINYRHYV